MEKTNQKQHKMFRWGRLDAKTLFIQEHSNVRKNGELRNFMCVTNYTIRLQITDVHQLFSYAFKNLNFSFFKNEERDIKVKPNLCKNQNMPVILTLYNVQGVPFTSNSLINTPFDLVIIPKQNFKTKFLVLTKNTNKVFKNLTW